MKVLHPQINPMGLPPEDYFCVVDDMGAELGTGYIYYQFQPNLYPEFPQSMYFKFAAKSSARYLLLGALVARARQLRDLYPNLRARTYTDISPDDIRARDFFLQNGFKCDDVEEYVVMPIPEGDGRVPMSCSVARVPLNTPDEQMAFVARMQQQDLTYLNMELLTSLMRQPHFLALGLYRNTELIGEILMAGQGDSCMLYGIYITPPNRRQGMARVLLHRSMAVMAAEGVTQVASSMISLSEPQVRLLQSFRAEKMGVTTVYPGLYL